MQPYTSPSQPQAQVQEPKLYVPASNSNFKNTTHLKTMICPIDIVANFLKLSYGNTNAKIETCAILAGIEKDGQLYINTLIVPPQTGKQD